MRVLALAVVVLLAGCSGAPAAATEDVDEAIPSGTLRGVVVDEAVVPLPDVTIMLGEETTVTDEDGRFEFADLEPGAYVVKASHPLYEKVQATGTVSDGPGDLVRIQMTRLFEADPFVDPTKLEGFINCGYSLALSSPCVIDYTMILFPGGLAPQLNGITGDVRRFIIPVEGGWQSMVTEITWESSASGTTPALSVTASFFNRTSSHSYTGSSGPDPLRMQIDMDANQTHPAWIPPEGKEDFLLFINPSAAGSELPFAVTVGQEFELFHHEFYYATPPEDWSFVGGDEIPY